MEPLELFAQIIGLFAMGLSIWSFQQKTQRKIITIQICSCTLFFFNFLLIGATVGALLNAIGLVRAIVYANKEKLKADKFVWLIGFTTAYIGVYALNFIALGTDFNLKNGLLEVLPVVAMIASNIGLKSTSAKTVRIAFLISAPLWWIYNFVVGSVGAVLCETFNIISIVIAMFRLDRPGKDYEQNEN